jgi:hypothetical protein
MKLYVCYGTWTAGAALHRHPCGEAHKALKHAGHKPQLVLSYGLGLAPDFVNQLAPGRREVKELTGNYWVPVLVLDDGTVIQGSQRIIDWAEAHPAGEGPAQAATRTGADSAAGAEPAAGG